MGKWDNVLYRDYVDALWQCLSKEAGMNVKSVPSQILSVLVAIVMVVTLQVLLSRAAFADEVVFFQFLCLLFNLFG